MFDFREIELGDKDRINERLAVSDFRGCEYTFANNLAWRRLSDTLICFYDDFYISCSFGENEVTVTFPAGVPTDNAAGVQKHIALFEELKKMCGSRRMILSSVRKEDLGWIKEHYRDSIEISAERDYFDYIYLSEDLIELKGKKYHGKRNHIKRFCEHDYLFRPITEDDFDLCTEFAARSYDRPGHGGFSAAVEQYAIYTYFTNFEYLGLCGAVLYYEGKLCGFTIGERLNSDTFVVHIEKADADIQGAYPMLCSQFARFNAGGYKYINREEDLGIEGLRRSKLSYHPAFMQEKYTVAFLH